MSKLRVHDLAGEFGIPADEVVQLVRAMDVPVRNHLSPLTDDQVARVRARWEREKRARAERQAAPAAPSRRRGAKPAAAAVEAAAEPVGTAAGATGAGVRRRRAADLPSPADASGDASGDASIEAVESAAAAEPPAFVAPPRRVETAAQVADAPPSAERPASAHEFVGPVRADAPAVEDRPAPRPVSAATRADEPLVAPPVQREPEVEQPAPVSAPAPQPPPAPRPPAVPSAPPRPTLSPTYSHGGGTTSTDQNRPRPIVPGAPRPTPVVPGGPRPRPVASGSPFTSGPRPVMSAAPGGSSAPPRRDDRRPGGASPGGGQSAAASGALGQRRGKKGKRGAVDQQAVTANISSTMNRMRGPARRGGRGDDERSSREEVAAERAAAAERERTTVRVNEFITVSELAGILKVPPTQIVGFAIKNLGLMVTINQRLDFDQIDLIASEFGFQAVREEEYQADAGAEVVEDTAEELVPRPPVVTIMGHVDHGKTSLLDYIRKANVVAGEAGGITQHIGAYHVTAPDGRNITFLDTPGHEAFTAMRARGAQVTDIVILVVAADDSVMPQTVEAISHARNAGVPMIVAINKVDLPQANPGKVKQELLQHGVVLEEFGGTVLSHEVSAKKGTGIQELLEQVLLQAEILDLRANPDRRAAGAVIEAQLDPGKGPVATVLVRNGMLRVGDDFICGLFSGRVRALLDERGKPVKGAGPAIPVQVLGMSGTPMAGDQFVVVEDGTEAREIAQRRERLDREARSRRTAKGVVSLEDFMSQTSAGETRQLKLLIKADQGGPAEAVADALQRLSTSEVQVDVIQRGVGAISESDILLAKAAGAVIIGFHVRPDNKARAAADREGVEIKLYRIIYEAVSDVRLALEGLLRPEQREIISGEAEVRATFKTPKFGTIAGSFVRNGTINRGAKARVIRDGTTVYDGTIGSLRRLKDDVREVKEGFECGIGIDGFNDIKVGDVVECYRTEEVARTLQADQNS